MVVSRTLSASSALVVEDAVVVVALVANIAVPVDPVFAPTMTNQMMQNRSRPLGRVAFLRLNMWNVAESRGGLGNPMPWNSLEMKSLGCSQCDSVLPRGNR